MFKKIVGFAVVLLLSGIGLSVYLPDFEPNEGVSLNPVGYQINQPSLKQPLIMSDMLLDSISPANQVYGLQLGLYGQLPQAIAQAQQYHSLTMATTIVKATDQQRYWYLLLLGPYDSQARASSQRLQLRQKQNISATLMQWPLATAQ